MGRHRSFHQHSEQWDVEYLEAHSQADLNLPLAVEIGAVDAERLAEGGAAEAGFGLT